MDYRERREAAEARARAVWPTLTESEQHGIRFGLFPAAVMRTAEADGIDGRVFTLALMDVAAKNGGMLA